MRREEVKWNDEAGSNGSAAEEAVAGGGGGQFGGDIGLTLCGHPLSQTCIRAAFRVTLLEKSAM